jgi:hypothetical protein
MAEHVMYKREAAWGTFLAPTATGTPLGTGGAVVVESFNVVPGINFMEVADTGPGGRGRLPGAPGEIAVSGQLATKLYPQMLGRFLRGVMGTRAVTPASETTGVAVTAASVASPTVITVASSAAMSVGSALLISGHSGGTPSLNGIHYVTKIVDGTSVALDVSVTVAGSWAGGNAKLTTNRNKLLFEDNTAFDSFSFQKYYDSTHAEFLRGCKITRFGVGVRSKEFAKMTIDFVGKDATKNGGNWADGSAAGAITPYTHAATGATGAWFYPPVLYDPLKFYQASIRIGGTVAVTAGEIVITGGSARTEIDNLAFDVNLGLGTDAYGVVLDDRTVQSIDEGPRVITASFEPNFKSVWFEFYDLWKANPQAPMILEAYFRGPVAYTVGGPAYLEYKFTFPNVRISSAPPPDQNAAYGLKRQTVSAQCAVDPVTGYDMGVVIQCPEDYTQ